MSVHVHSANAIMRRSNAVIVQWRMTLRLVSRREGRETSGQRKRRRGCGSYGISLTWRLWCVRPLECLSSPDCSDSSKNLFIGDEEEGRQSWGVGVGVREVEWQASSRVLREEGWHRAETTMSLLLHTALYWVGTAGKGCKTVIGGQTG